MCTATVIHYCTDDRQLLIAITPAVIDPTPDIGQESRFVPNAPAFNASVREGSRRNIAETLGVEKLEWIKHFDKIH